MKITFINKADVISELKLAGWMAGVSKDSESSPLKIAEYCLNSGHDTPFRSCRFIFEIEGVSRAFSHEFVRHEIGVTKVQRSQRYVAEDNFEYVTPESLKGYCMDFSDGKSIMTLNYDDVQTLIKGFYMESLRRGVQPEDARYILSNATCTKLRVAFNWEGLKNFCYRRCCNKAQWEIREVADEIKKQVIAEFPFDISEVLGAPCEIGKCPENHPCGGKY